MAPHLWLFDPSMRVSRVKASKSSKPKTKKQVVQQSKALQKLFLRQVQVESDSSSDLEIED